MVSLMIAAALIRTVQNKNVNTKKCGGSCSFDVWDPFTIKCSTILD